jgi:hypothetical protein
MKFFADTRTLVIHNIFKILKLHILHISKQFGSAVKHTTKCVAKVSRGSKNMPGRWVPKSTIFPDDAICRKCEKGFQITWQKMTRPPGPCVAASQQSDLQETNS